MEKKRRCPFCHAPLTTEDWQHYWMLMVSTATGTAMGLCIAAGIVSLALLTLWYLPEASWWG